ncbi:MAG: M20/M25/M40 family metallo-hydrolase [Bryobacterales bacterium]|nr:M20/M25/M40 family metallo-hydrolase [Bryobacterales bacterium]
MRFLTPLGLLLLSPLHATPPIEATVPPPIHQSLSRISPNALKAHVSFLASDVLEGRNTPSRGLEVAAEYIAAQFRRAGLEPIPGGDSYFQIAPWVYKQIPLDGVKLQVRHGEQTLELDSTHLSLQSLDSVDLANTPVFLARIDDTDSLKSKPENHLAGKVALALVPSMAQIRGLPREERGERMRVVSNLFSELRRLKPAFILAVRNDSEQGAGATGQLTDPSRPPSSRRSFFQASAVHSAKLAALLDPLPSGDTPAQLTLHLRAPVERPAPLKNVIGVLPGSDPQLKDSFILITAHYDHIGATSPNEAGDGIYNGANDDASGVASILEVASAFAALPQRTKRTLIFMAMFGEEKGLLGAQYYAAHPVFPLAKTIANVNLEHMGRTDATEGPQLNRLSPTGFGFTEVIDYFQLAGNLTGVEIFHHKENSEAFFPRSDNQAFANFGVPAHTFCVAFEFPDYHGLGDHWEKIDYNNMARVTGTVATAAWMMSERPQPPEWHSLSQTEKYREARQKEGNKSAQ